MGSITKVVSHPTLPLTITAHEDRHIRFFDNKSGKQTHVMVAHLDAVTSLAIDTNGLYLISGSKKFIFYFFKNTLFYVKSHFFSIAKKIP